MYASDHNEWAQQMQNKTHSAFYTHGKREAQVRDDNEKKIKTK